ncbi:MAG: SDR family oxidoreductase, partial [Mucilaginibacter sp.]
NTVVHVITACPGFYVSNIRNLALAKDGSHQGESSMEEEKMMTAEEVAKIIADGVEKRSRTLIMTGQGKLTIAFTKFFPAWLDKLVYSTFAKEKDPLLK